MIEFQQNQALTSHFESFWSEVVGNTDLDWIIYLNFNSYLSFAIILVWSYSLLHTINIDLENEIDLLSRPLPYCILKESYADLCNNFPSSSLPIWFLFSKTYSISIFVILAAVCNWNSIMLFGIAVSFNIENCFRNKCAGPWFKVSIMYWHF